MADPLSALLGKKKEEQAAQAKTAPAARPEVAVLGDVSAVLGRSSRTSAGPAASAADVFAEVEAVLGVRQPAAPSTPSGGYPAVARTLSATGGAPGGDRDKLGEGARAALAAMGGALTAAGGLLRTSTPAPSPSAASSTSIGGGSASPSPLSSPAFGVAPPVPAAGLAATTFEDMLAGEKVHVVIKTCFLLVTNPLCELRGRLLVTNYRLKFQTPKGTLREELIWMREVGYFDVPMGTIEEVKEERSTTAAGVPEVKLKVVTKDLRTLILLPSPDEDVRGVFEAVTAFSVPGNPTLLFAFKHAEEVWAAGKDMQDLDGWNLYDPMQEYARMGVETDLIASPLSPWRVSQLNADYGLCPSYPSLLALPRRMSEQDLRAVAAFRKRARLPAMSWCGGPELAYASLWRCSQTTEGLMGQKCMEDQKLVECIRQGGTQQREEDRELLVIDLRPWKSAWANKAGGGGFEGYPKCRLVFGGIDNVHAVRDAWRAMSAAVVSVSDGEVGTWYKDVANSSWYDYIGAIMSSTLKVIKEILDRKGSVMVHCSDGWDRTAQVTSLAMLCLDPEYRTQAGFLRLVQKEWCSFGHRFRTRLALGEAPSSEYSPVFIQWLECVYQLCRQFPTSFEFSTSLLLRLATEVTSNRYGTFLCDSEKERVQRVMPYAVSLWSVLLRPEDAATWQNPNYKPDRERLHPAVCQAGYVMWNDYWWRYHPRSQKLKAQGLT